MRVLWAGIFAQDEFLTFPKKTVYVTFGTKQYTIDPLQVASISANIQQFSIFLWKGPQN